MRFGVIDEIITEPVGGAHRDPAAAIAATGEAMAARARRPDGPRPRYRPAPAAREIPGHIGRGRFDLTIAIPVYLSFSHMS